MLLTIDIGNTNITFGLYDASQTLQYLWRIKTDHERLADEYGIMMLGLMGHEGLKFSQITGVAMASVVPPLTQVFVKMSERYMKVSPLVVGVGVKTGVQIRYDSPRDVGADRIAANGDVANKIGTYPLAVLAREHGVPFYVAAPTSTLDLALESGREIPIEERPADEVLACRGYPVAPQGVSAFNPAFDVTSSALVAAIVTERGIARPPYGESLAALTEGGS